MDGATKETYEKIKQGCSFDNVIENVEYIIQKRRSLRQYKPDVNFRYVMTKDNIHEIPMFIDLVNSLGPRKDFAVSSINFTGLLYFEGIKELYADKIPEDIVNELKSRVGKGIYFRFDHPIDELNPSMSRCYYWMEPYIMMGGYVLPCCQVLMSNNRLFLREHAFGNVFQQSFTDIWNSDRYRRFRKINLCVENKSKHHSCKESDNCG